VQILSTDIAALIQADLRASGLAPLDIFTRQIGNPEIAATNSPARAQGYVIPYFDINGNPIPYYRVKLFNHRPKYKQPKGTPHHVYFPPKFRPCLERFVAQRNGQAYVLVTEGEKKAASACKLGIPSVGLGGVDSWRTSIILLPPDTSLESVSVHGSDDRIIRARLPSTNAPVSDTGTLAIGLSDLIALTVANKINMVIAFDSDQSLGPKFEVQRAAAGLAYEMRYRGISSSRIRQIILPTEGNAKVGLDDYLANHSVGDLEALVKDSLETPSAFPRHPNPRAFIQSRLEKPKLRRREAQDVSLAIMCELDARGRRLLSAADRRPYFFDDETRELMQASMMTRTSESLHESRFGTFLYKTFGLAEPDSKVMGWLATMFTGEGELELVSPKRVITPLLDGSGIAIQINDGDFAVITGDPDRPILICGNGTHGILFERGHVEPLSPIQVLNAFSEAMKVPLSPWWMQVLYGVRLEGDDTTRRLATLLFYISPWLNRWRGTQLPVEMVIGEAGSGKSSLYELRLCIITGRPILRNIPTDMKDWYTSVANTGGLHVTDNVHFTLKDLKQRISDEMCRLVTEPDPHVETRRLYTNLDTLRTPINVVFAFTAIQQPFVNSDLIQRSVIFNLALGSSANVDTRWGQQQLNKYGGRLSWLVHHMVFLHKFFRAAAETGQWDAQMRTSHRLTNYEQCLNLAGKVLNIPIEGIATNLKDTTEQIVLDSDWTLAGLLVFADEVRANHTTGKKFVSQDISAWALASEEYNKDYTLSNSRSLGRYMVAHKETIRRITGIEAVGTIQNRRQYLVVGMDKKETTILTTI